MFRTLGIIDLFISNFLKRIFIIKKIGYSQFVKVVALLVVYIAIFLTAGEIYYLRLLLLEIPGPIKQEDLYTFEGVLYLLWYIVCVARSLIYNDSDCYKCFKKTILQKNSQRIQDFFVSILTANTYINFLKFQDIFKNNIYENLIYTLSEYLQLGIPAEIEHLDFNYSLFLIK